MGEKLKISKDKEAFRLYLEGLGLAPRTTYIYSTLVPQLSREVKNTEPETLRKYLKRHPSPVYFGAIVHYCRWRYDTDIKNKIKYKGVKPKRRPALSVSQLKVIVDDLETKLAQRERVIVKLNLATGRRISEILTLKSRQIDWENSRINFKTAKGGQDVSFKINPGLMREIKDYIEDSGLLAIDSLFYPNRPNTRQKEKSKYDQYTSALRRAGASPEVCRTHNFRRAVINYLITKKGVEYASAFVGHESIDTTMKYLNEETRQKLISEAAEVMADE